MKAVFQPRYGPPEGLEVREVEKPVPAENEVLVRVRAASVHADVWHVITGRPYVLRVMGAGFSRPKNPIPGIDVAGVVEAVGKRVGRFRPGDPVFGMTLAEMQWANGGAFAEYVSVPEDFLEPKPRDVGFEQAASVPSSGYITVLNLRGIEQWRPESVLINGAGGAVGSMALQLVKAHDARVTAVDSTKKLDFLRRLGADEVIDYTQDDFTARDESYDLVFDIPGNRPYSACRRVLAPGGRYILIGHERFGAAGSRFFGIMPRFFGLMLYVRYFERQRNPTPVPSRKETTVLLRDYLEAGTIAPVIDRTFSLSEAPQAFRYLAEGEPLGRIVITP